MPQQTPHTRLLVRERVTEALLAATAQYPLILLTAPTGYGKTMAALALAEALPSRAARRVYRLSMTAGADGLDGFWERAATQLAAQGAPIAEHMRGTRFPRSKNALQRFLDFAREELLRHNSESVPARGASRKAGGPRNLFASALPQPLARTVLIMDDYQSVQEPRLDAFLATLAREELPGLCVLVISWSRIPLPMEELKLKGLAMEYGPEFLAFSLDDAQRFFRLHDNNNAAAAARAWEMCAGWPAALYLCLAHPFFAPSDQDAGPGAPYPDDALYAPGKPPIPHTVEELLRECVLDRLDEGDRRLLLHLCVLDEFTPQQAAYVSGDLKAVGRLRELYDKNVLIARDAKGLYLMHPLLREFLRRQLETVVAGLPGEHGSGGSRRGGEQPALDIPSLFRRSGDLYLYQGDTLRAVFRRAGNLYLSQGDTLRAIRAFAEAGRDEDYDRILEMFEHHEEHYSLARDPEGVSSVVLSIPWALRRARPLGYLGFIYQYITCVDPEKGADLLRRAELDFFSPGNVEVDLQPSIAGEMAQIRGALAFGNLQEMAAAWGEAYSLLQGPSQVARSGHALLQSSPHAGLVYHHVPGGYEEVVTLCAEELPEYLALSGGSGTGVDLLMQAEWLLETGRFGAVNVKALQADYAARSKGQTAVRVAIALTRARLALAMETEENPIALLEELAPEVSGNPMLAASLDLSKGYVLAQSGKTRRIPVWLQKGELDPARTLHQGMGMEYVVHGKALLALGRYRYLADFAEVMESIFRPASCLFGLMHTHCLHAAALVRQHDPDAAAPILKKALDMARPDGILLPITEYGEHIVPALEILQRQAALARPSGVKRPRARTVPQAHVLSEETHIATVLSLTRKQGQRSGQSRETSPAKRKSGTVTRDAALLEGLTARGKDVLRLAAQGKTNPQIAASLGVKPVTVGKVLMGVFRTLGVKNRVEAVNLWQKYTAPGED